jgi:phage terminase large subunit
LEYYFELLLHKAYQYDTIWLPHDARAKTLQTGRSTVEQFLNPEQIDPKFKGISFPVDITPSLKKQHGIDAARLILPKCYINSTTCAEGIEALRAYRRKYNDITKSLSNEPLHDWSSDGSDAFRYLALVTKDRALQAPPSPINSEQLLKSGYNLHDLFAEREKPKHSYERRRV